MKIYKHRTETDFETIHGEISLTLDVSIYFDDGWQLASIEIADVLVYKKVNLYKFAELINDFIKKEEEELLWEAVQIQRKKEEENYHENRSQLCYLQ